MKVFILKMKFRKLDLYLSILKKEKKIYTIVIYINQIAKYTTTCYIIMS